MCDLTTNAESRYALKSRALAMLERAVLRQQDRIDEACLRWERGEVCGSEGETDLVRGLAGAIIEAVDVEADPVAMIWFVALGSEAKWIALVGAAICAVDVRLGTKGRPCVWRNAIKGRKSAAMAAAKG
jgi:hypothetical protein